MTDPDLLFSLHEEQKVINHSDKENKENGVK